MVLVCVMADRAHSHRLWVQDLCSQRDRKWSQAPSIQCPHFCGTPFSSFHMVSQEDTQAVLPSLGVACFTETASQSSGSKPVGQRMSNKLRCGAIQLAWGPHIDPRVCGGQSPAAWTLSLVARPCAPLESEPCRYSQL